jgi:regulatory protein
MLENAPPCDDRSSLETTHRKVYRQALRLLTRRSYTRRELKRKLTDQGAAGDAADMVINRCRQLGYLNDHQLGCDLIHRVFRKGYGPARVRQDLRRKCYTRDEIGRLMESCDCAGLEPPAARQALRKKAKALRHVADIRKRREKACRFLHSRGFSQSVVRDTVDAYLAGSLPEDPPQSGQWP